MMDELASALLTCDFGQVWARYDFVQRVAQSRTDFGQHLAQNCVPFWARSDTTLGNMLHET